MPEEAKIHFYSIRKCGYYKPGTGNLVFGDLPGILLRFHNWSTAPGLTLKDTCTFALHEDEENSLRTFCFDIISNNTTGDYFLTTWNETPSNQGKVPSVSGDQPVGSAEVHLNDIEAGTIPGYATYFWFIPQLAIFATIKFQHVLNGQQNLVRYMNGFMENFSGYAVTNQIDDDNMEIVGYRENANDAIQELFPSFRSKMLRKSGEIELIKQKRASIRKMIRKSELDLQIDEDKNLLQKMLSKFGITGNDDPGNNSLNVNYSFNFNPTEDELNEIIEQALDEGLTRTNDYGFQFVGKSEVCWLSNSIVKHEVNLDIQRDNDEIVNLQSLANNLTNNRQIIVNIINGIQ